MRDRPHPRSGGALKDPRANDRSESSPRPGRRELGSRPDPPGLSGRFLAAAAALWTLACGAWFASTALDGKLDTMAVAVAVAGLIGIVWLFGLLFVLLFWVGRGDPDDPESHSGSEP